MAWFKRTFDTYRDNATSVRDFRSQLRGAKAVYLWGAYLAVLVIVAVSTYSSTLGHSDGQIMWMQQQLQNFYYLIMALLATTICVITPALTAGTIALERQRQSLDLLFSAPASLKSLLVGKMLSSYRYTWMLLALALPISCICVVVGGATWGDVLSAYLMLSFSGIVLTSIGLLVSTLTTSISAAVIWTYAAVAAYLSAISSLAASSVSVPHSASWLAGLSPFTAAIAAPGSVSVFGLAVPNWVPVGLVSLAFSRIILLGAGSALSHFRSPETISLRIHWVIYSIVGFFGLGWIASESFSRYNGPEQVNPIPAVAILGATLVSLLVIPNLVCYAKDEGRKYRDNGRFALREAFTGARSGSLPYLLILWLSAFVSLPIGYLVAAATQVRIIQPGYGGEDYFHTPMAWGAYLSSAVWSLGFILMWWSIARWLSSRTGTLRFARLSFIGTAVVLLGMPIPIISLLTNAGGQYDYNNGIHPLWSLSPFFPFLRQETMAYAAIYGIVMMAIATMAYKTEVRPKPVSREKPPTVFIEAIPEVTTGVLIEDKRKRAAMSE
jgi:hypothetical protein